MAQAVLPLPHFRVSEFELPVRLSLKQDLKGGMAGDEMRGSFEGS
jgi:hypothetical protein